MYSEPLRPTSTPCRNLHVYDILRLIHVGYLFGPVRLLSILLRYDLIAMAEEEFVSGQDDHRNSHGVMITKLEMLRHI